MTGKLRLKVLKIYTLRFLTVNKYLSIFVLLFLFKPEINEASKSEFEVMHYNLTDSVTTDTLENMPRSRSRRFSSPDTLIIESQETDIDVSVPEKPDTLDTEETKAEIKKSEKKEHKHSPARAAMLSATLPGLGQIYNRKYWKVPIVYAGFGAVIYFVNFNNTNYQDFRKAYIYRIDGNPNTIDEYPDYSADVLEKAMNFYRRNLEISYIAGGVLYVLNILDATVDAHLFDFNVNEDLSINIRPGIMPSYSNTNSSGFGTGLSVFLKF